MIYESLESQERLKGKLIDIATYVVAGTSAAISIMDIILIIIGILAILR